MKLNARVENMPYGVTIVVCSSHTPITELEKQPILAQINQEYTVESSLFLKYGVIARVRSMPETHRKGRR